MDPVEAALPLVSIVVVNWNGAHILGECLASLDAQTWPRREFVIVDNGSVDGSDELIGRWAAGRDDVRTLFLDENTGFTRGNNLAFPHTRGEWIALVNNDAVAEPEWLANLVRHGHPAEGIGMVGGKILFHGTRIIDKTGHLIYWDGQNRGRGTMEEDRGQFDTPGEILWPDACAAIYHRRLIEETGGFDESFFAYGDDADLGMRARLLGWRAWYAPDAVVYHHHSATAGAYSPLKVMLVERNRILLAVKNFPLSVLLLNPWWTLRRFAWQAYGALGRKGAAGRFVGEHGRWRLLGSLGWAWLSAAKRLGPALVRRRAIQRSKRLSDREVRDLLRRYQIDLRELTLRD